MPQCSNVIDSQQINKSLISPCQINRIEGLAIEIIADVPYPQYAVRLLIKNTFPTHFPFRLTQSETLTK